MKMDMKNGNSGMQYHHVGIPTTVSRPGEIHVPHLKLYVVPYDSNPYGIEWIRFEPGSNAPEVVKTIPHVAFTVENLEVAIAGQDILIPPASPSPGVQVAFILVNGAPVEFLEYDES